ncbi:MAG: hypothetical protein CME62_11545 [Halobacteriovoraceae bacterium]|nr:hypothetical protein [Halobacteriovoraceae bacterium]|tara:strand:+ start:901 stop:1857 length:957 start_codon:yes stop_codon:yes gene_type:complete
MTYSKLNLLVLALTTLLITGCRPNQPATDYAVTKPIDKKSKDDKKSSSSDEAAETVESSGEELEPTPQEPQEELTDLEIGSVHKTCQNAKARGQLLESHEEIFFPATMGCHFNKTGHHVNDLNAQGNGPIKNMYIRARTEQYQTLKLKENVTVCGMKFEFEEQSMQYDDEIFLTLNDYVLMMSTDYSENSPSKLYRHRGLKVNDYGLTEYKWLGKNSLYNLDYNRYLTPHYCLGTGLNKKKCHVPKTQEKGRIKLDIPDLEIVKIGLLNEKEARSTHDTHLKFGFVATGDDDTNAEGDIDCRHSDFGFKVIVQYVENP